MEWVCPKDKQELSYEKGLYICKECQTEYKSYDGVPCFAETDIDKKLVDKKYPELEQVLNLLQKQNFQDTARAFCKNRQCSRNSLNADWKFFFSFPKDAQVLELGGGLGDDTVDIAKKAEKVTVLVPNAQNASILHYRVKNEKKDNIAIGITRRIEKLPFPDKSFDSIAMEDAAAPGFNISDRNMDVITAEWKRILKPGGTIFVGLSNPYYRWPAAQWLKSKLQSRQQKESLNRYIKKEGSVTAYNRIKLNNIIACMSQNGYRHPVIYTPFPDENKTKIVVPVEDDHVMHYFLNYLIRKNSVMVRIAISVAQSLVNLKLFRYLVPYYFLIFKESEKTATQESITD